MKALSTEPPGGWDATRFVERPLPEGGDNQVLVGIRSVGLNPADAFQIEGRYPGGPQPPFIAGRDAAGIVLKSDAANSWQPGDAVVVMQSSARDLRNGTLCEQQWFAADNLARLPVGWSFAEGGSAPLVYLTAWKALTGPGPLSPGRVVLVTGASGGVGLAAVHLAAGLGATVVALSRSESKRKRLLEQGANFAFAPDEDHLKEKLADATGKKGVDVVVENVGGSQLTQAVHLLGVYGRISQVGVLAGVEAAIPIPAFMFKRASLHGILVSDDTPVATQAAWTQIVDILQRTGRRPVIDRVFPFDQTRAAFDHLRSGIFGKVVVEVVP